MLLSDMGGLGRALVFLILGGLALFFQSQYRLMDRFSQWPVRWQAAGVVAALAAIATLGVFEGAQFIYFQF